MGELVLETAHRDPLAADLRVVQKPEREISTWPPTQPATSGWRVAMRHWSCRYSQVSGRPRLRRRRMPPPMNTPKATPSTTNRSEEHTSELQSLMRISYAVFCLTKKKTNSEEG